MFPTALLTAFLLLAVSVAANPIVVRKPSVSLSFARHLNITGSRDLVAKDQARAKNLVAIGKAKQSGILSRAGVVSVGVTNVGVSYHATVGVGSPPTNYNLLIDTGSSNTWVGAGKTYVRTNTSIQTHNNMSVTYDHKSFSCTEFTDTVTIGPGLVIPGQSIGVASNFTGFSGLDGVLGIGPTDLTVGTLSPDTGSSVPTVTDNLFSSGTIPSNLVSVSFEPTTTESEVNGELTFGGTDSEKYTGAITFIPITSASPASHYWGIDESIWYGASTSILSTTAGIVDTGTTFILIATDAFDRYTSATGAVLDATTGLLTITPAQFANLQSLFFTTGGTTFELTANAQIWPRALNTLIGGTSGKIYLIVNDIRTSTGQGLDFINGYTFLERFYSVYDTENHRVGLATTPFTTATTN
ncbi:aspartic peptidase domain-containing protein [Multifurca ochricompacta]|uniref:Aspartic peptidase domain-containing protein n=1 Tax=Multifurca ochricompacta TaxID=376703 RepID=A0AAD4QLD1_9AGAM|nr:aspartic peptidase domain-containing protein [Multifurca ochricompacta]